MTEITLHAKASSRDEPYEVTFTLNDGILLIWCDCPAGVRGQLCKHKLSLAANKKAMLFDENQVEQLHKAYIWVENSGLFEAIEEVHIVEKELESLKNKFKGTKAKIARLMRDGVK